MLFSNPLFLFGLFAILVPIIIHLFNFRKYKTYYFSNVRMLKEVMMKTRRESQVQHLIVLGLRILGIAALVFAFAQPYIPHSKQQENGGNLVTLFVDNSFSMDANSQESNLLQDALAAAKDIVNAYSYSDDFVLITQDFSAKQSHILNKEEVLSQLDEIEVSPNSHSLEEVLAFENSVCNLSDKENVTHYYISDFQKCNFDFAQLKHEKESRQILVPTLTKAADNISIDSCWFLTPVFKKGQQVTLMARVSNYGDDDVAKMPIKLYVNDKQVAMSALDLKAKSSAEIPMNYTIDQVGCQCAKLLINDAPITYDDQLYFTYQVTDATKIVSIYENQPNKFLKAMYGKDSLFVYKEMNVKQMDYSQLADCQLVILNEVSQISSGLASELKQYVLRGGSLLCFPNENADLRSWQTLLTAMECDYFTSEAKSSVKVGSLNYECRYFKGSLESTDASVEKPVVLKYFEQTKQHPFEPIMSLENGSPLLSAYTFEKGTIFLSAVPFNDDFGNVHKHALSFVPFHNIGIMSQLQEKLFCTIGLDNQFMLNQISSQTDEVFVLKSRAEGAEIIPEQRTMGNSTSLFFQSQITAPGFYDVAQANTTYNTLAFNYNRQESDLTYYSESELAKLSKQGEPFEIIEAGKKNLTGQIAQQLNGTPLWRYFVLLALICFLAEIAVLRFWKSNKIEDSTSTTV